MQKLIYILLLFSINSTTNAACNNLLDFEIRKLHSQETVNLCEQFADKVIVAVNTASQCGFTYQFEELEGLYKKYKDEGVVVLGFPSNDFNQEHSDESKVAEVCYVNYGVSFPMFTQSSVRGESANSFFKSLASEIGSPGWNFFKYVIDKNGDVVNAFGSSVNPLDSDLERAVVSALQNKKPF